MKTNVQTTRRGFTLVELLVVITIIAALAALVSPQVLRGLKKADLNTAISNSRQIGQAMFEFQTEYGRFPDASTAARIAEDFPDSDITPSQDSSNGYFRQLFVAGIVDSEDIFYAKTAITKKPDGAYNGADCLEKGEVAFGYILDGEDGLTTGGSASRVIAVAPRKDEKFDVAPFDKKATALRIDQSVQVLNVNKDGEALLGGGKKLEDTGVDTIWGADVTPTVSEPEPL
jgi:prepilin-type N-terminal cleavage/methylation domain-containing protein